MPPKVDLEKVYERVGNNISFLRKKKGFTQEELAVKMCIHSQSLVSQYENAKKAMTFEKIKEFCDFFEVSLQDMLFTDFSDAKDNKQIENRLPCNSGPISKCANRTYYGYHIKEQNDGDADFNTEITSFEMDVLSAVSQHNAAVKLFLNGRDHACYNGMMHMDESYAYIVCHDWEKDWFWQLTFYYYRKRQSPRYLGGMAMLQTLDFHLLPTSQLCILSINAIASKHNADLQRMLKVDPMPKVKTKLSHRDFSSLAILRLTKEKDKRVFLWLQDKVKVR